MGLVESRPRSGYFVRARRTLPVPLPSRPAAHPRPVTAAALIQSVLAANRDERLVPLGIAAPPPALLPEAALARAASAASARRAQSGLAYEFPPGNAALRRAIARRALSWGYAASADDVVVTSGASEAVNLALAAVTKPGDAVAIESPSYYGTLQALEAHGLHAVEIPCCAETGLDLDALERALGTHAIAAVLAVPNFANPLGTCMSDAAKRRLVELVSARGIPLIEDDVYGDLGFDGSRPPAAKAFDKEGLVLSCSSFSKTLAPGWRVGFIAPGRFREQVLLRKFALNVATATLPQRAVARFLESGAYDRHLRRMRGMIRASAERMFAAVTASFPQGTRVSRPSGGYVLWIELPETVDALELHARALDAGVSVAPGHVFRAGSSGYEHFVRLSYATPWSERIQAAVETVGRIATRLAEARARGA
jgi:DNA-binding transcriptional MocR family regulator